MNHRAKTADNKSSAKTTSAIRWKKLFYRLSMAGIPLIMLPVVYFGCSVVFRNGIDWADPDGWMLARYWGQNFLGGLICWGLTLVADWLRNRDRDDARLALAANILMGVGLIAELAAFAVVNFAFTAPFWISLAAVVPTYILVWRKAGGEYQAVIDKKMVTAYCIESIAAVIFFWAIKVSYSRMVLVWGLFYLISCYALCQNQSNIDFMMARRKHRLEHLPDRVRGRSLKLTLVVIGIGLICVLLAPQLGWLLEQLLNGLKYLLSLIVRLIAWLIPDSEPSETVEETVPQNDGDMGGLVGAEQGSPWWDYIMWPAIIALICWLVYTYRDQIMRSLITFWRALRSKVKGALFSVPARAGLMADAEGEYEDEVVELEASELDEQDNAEKFRLRKWKKAVRLWRSEIDSPEKYRSGYRLALDWLSWKKVPVSPSDTPLELLEKAREVLPASDWETVTEWYNLIRYGEPDPFPTQSLPVIDRALAGMESSGRR